MKLSDFRQKLLASKQTALTIMGVFILTGLCAWALSPYSPCESGVFKFAKEREGNTNCIEFWANRYQGLISGLLALATALIASMLVLRQLDGMRAANKISRKAQSISQYEAVTKRFHAINGGTEIYKNLTNIMIDLDYYNKVLSTQDIDSHFWSEINQTRDRIESLKVEINLLENGLTHGIIFSDQVEPLKKALEKLDHSIWTFISENDKRPLTNTSAYSKIAKSKFNKKMQLHADDLTESMGKFAFSQAKELQDIKLLMKALERAMMT